MNHCMTKPTKWPECPAKTQIRLGGSQSDWSGRILVWSEPSLSAWRNPGKASKSNTVWLFFHDWCMHIKRFKSKFLFLTHSEILVFTLQKFIHFSIISAACFTPFTFIQLCYSNSNKIQHSSLISCLICIWRIVFKLDHYKTPSVPC